MKSFLWQRKIWLIALSLLLLLALSLAACGNTGGGNRSSSSPATARAASPSTTPAPTSIIKAGAQPCPDAVKDSAHWDRIIPTHRPDSQVKSVTCAYLVGTPSLQALVTVDK